MNERPAALSHMFLWGTGSGFLLNLIHRHDFSCGWRISPGFVRYDIRPNKFTYA